MGLFGRLKAKLLDNYCERCGVAMDTLTENVLFLLPMTVGNFVEHRDAAYYLKHLHRISDTAQIPVGMYACRMTVYRCPECMTRVVKLFIFLRVRENEKFEDVQFFRSGELDGLVNTL